MPVARTSRRSARSAPKIALAMCLFAASVIGKPVWAQNEPTAYERSRGLEAESVSKAMKPDLVRAIEKAVAECAVKQRSAKVLQLLALSDQETIPLEGLAPSFGQLQIDLGIEQCLSRVMEYTNFGMVTLRYDNARLRAALAEEAYLFKTKRPLVRDASWTEVVPGQVIVEGRGPSTTTARIKSAFSDCLVFHASREADELVRTMISSRQETAAVKALIPALSNCVGQGEKVDLTVASVRSFAANGLWARVAPKPIAEAVGRSAASQPSGAR